MTNREDIRWSLAQRFEYIEWRIYWTGRVNRSDLVEKFGVSTPQASSDLQAYQKMAPNNIEYDATEKAYIGLSEFCPVYLDLSADRYLLQLNAILTGAISPGDTWFSSPPPAAVVKPVIRNVEPAMLRGVLQAIEQQREVKILYQSLSGTRLRSIAPHSIAFDGSRWHVRAWCAEHEDFRDFVLTRILSLEPGPASKANAADDIEWVTLVELDIIPHPGLRAEQKSAIEHDFGMRDGSIRLKTRLALAFYLIKQLNLDLPDHAVTAERKQIYLRNAKEIEDADLAAKAQSRERVRLRVAKHTNPET